MVEHCSANAEATGSNPVEGLEAPKFFFGLFRNCLNCDSLRWSHIHFICISAVHIFSFCETRSYRFIFVFKKRERRQSPVVNQKAVLVDKSGIGGAVANTSGFFSNAVVGQAVDDRRHSWFHRFSFSRKSVNPGAEPFGQNNNASGNKKLRKFSTKRNSKPFEEGMVKPTGCLCFQSTVWMC